MARPFCSMSRILCKGLRLQELNRESLFAFFQSSFCPRCLLIFRGSGCRLKVDLPWRRQRRPGLKYVNQLPEPPSSSQIPEVFVDHLKTFHLQPIYLSSYDFSVIDICICIVHYFKTFELQSPVFALKVVLCIQLQFH